VASPFLVADSGTNPAPINTVLGEVLAQWPQMFRIMNLFCMLFIIGLVLVRFPDDLMLL
jgi:hypothetical protein